ncbi:MAG: YgiT-type zinc finger protein [Candidatus Eremiobacterota bacterium]
MKCSMKDCQGEYEERNVVHTVTVRGEVRIFDNVPAEVCSLCGDVLLKPETVRRIEQMLHSSIYPKRTAPVYDYV